MIAPSDRTSLHQAARRRGLAIHIDGDTIRFLRPARLVVEVFVGTPEGYREGDGLSRGIELLAEVTGAERARAWLRGYGIRQNQEMAL